MAMKVCVVIASLPCILAFYLRNPTSNKCIDITDFKYEPKTKLQLWTCTGAENQQWEWHGYALKNPASGMCVDIYKGSDGSIKYPADKARLQLYGCNNLDNQAFTFPDAPGGWPDSNLFNEPAGKCVDIYSPTGKADDGTPLQFYSCNHRWNQVWREEGLPLRGVNQACAEFGSKLPGTLGRDYRFPDTTSLKHFALLGFRATRLPFRWERLQQTLRGNFDDTYFKALQQTVSYIASLGGVTILDPHNYARYNGAVIGDGVAVDDFIDLWKRLASHYKDDRSVIFALMNEPNQMSTDSWADTAQKTINAIRETGARQLVLVPGNAWTNAGSWFATWYGTANAVAFQSFTDPGQNFAFEFHEYLDAKGTGTSEVCDSESHGIDALRPVTKWLQEHGFRGFLGEFGAGNNDVCQRAVDAMLREMEDNSDVWVGWTWWAAGPWWHTKFYNVEPNADGSDKPQTSWLRKYVSALAPESRVPLINTSTEIVL